jgi:hypothetical protein
MTTSGVVTITATISETNQYNSSTISTTFVISKIPSILTNLTISNRDFLVEESSNGLLIKFIKSNFEFNLDDNDYIEIIGDIEKYA